MNQFLLKGLLEKNLKIKKAPLVQGCVRVYFPNPNIEDIVITNDAEVDMFKRINITADDIRKSNLPQLVLQGDLVICQ